MQTLTDPLPEKTTYQGAVLRLNLSFDVVLRSFDLLKEKNLDDFDKIEIGLRMFVKNYRKIKGLRIEQKFELFKKISDEYIAVGRKGKSDDIKAFSFSEDSIYIYSAFLMDYGIDLFKEQGKMHWWRFLSMFYGLSERTKIREIMAIRTQDVPEVTKHNSAQIKKLYEAKAFYALRSDPDFQGDLNKLFDTLCGMAVKK